MVKINIYPCIAQDNKCKEKKILKKYTPVLYSHIAGYFKSHWVSFHSTFNNTVQYSPSFRLGSFKAHFTYVYGQLSNQIWDSFCKKVYTYIEMRHN